MPQLHDNSDFWADRTCFREPVPETFTAADLLSRAVDAHLKGHHAQASSLIAQANMPDIRDWYQPIMGKESPEIHRERPEEDPDTSHEIPKDKRDSKRHPSAEMKDALIARDGYRCRFCGIPTIRRARLRPPVPHLLTDRAFQTDLSRFGKPGKITLCQHRPIAVELGHNTAGPHPSPPRKSRKALLKKHGHNTPPMDCPFTA